MYASAVLICMEFLSASRIDIAMLFQSVQCFFWDFFCDTCCKNRDHYDYEYHGQCSLQNNHLFEQCIVNYFFHVAVRINTKVLQRSLYHTLQDFVLFLDMVFVPTWQILFKETGQSEEYTSWAEFNAINGTLINAIFR